ncbi:MAG: hypothetical protein ACR2HD_12165 [Solirubrobacteraceae bacterium]|nr:MAG: hypothetical protein DLM63_02140 [Solirubrobacterales bacterium]
MADGPDVAGSEAPPVAEEIHLPGPTAVPLINAFGLALAVIGLALGIGITIVGLVIFVLSLVRWIRDTRHAIDDLPRQHD